MSSPAHHSAWTVLFPLMEIEAPLTGSRSTQARHNRSGASRTWADAVRGA
ncbi:hypothetical protein QFZ75_002619 [Streptomyces sp. V3I8]|nr:hypothetical protein [Streptomyces sp. V3I8]MDQ1036203.1 hypothetical protein [Streptomyces sp. V3I8]